MSISGKRRHTNSSHGKRGFQARLSPSQVQEVLSAWVIRHELGLTRKTLALAMGVSPRTIQRIVAQDREEKLAKEAALRNAEREEKIEKRAKGLYINKSGIKMDEARIEARRQIEEEERKKKVSSKT